LTALAEIHAAALTEELRTLMILAGAPDIASITAGCVARA
jgi:hypothetical protein